MLPPPPIFSESAARYHATLVSVLGTASRVLWIGAVPDDIADAGSPERCIEGMTFPGVMGSPIHKAVPPLAEGAYEVAVCNLVDLGVLVHVLPVVRAALRADGRLIVGLANGTSPKNPVSSLRAILDVNGYVFEEARIVSDEHTNVAATGPHILLQLDELLALPAGPSAESYVVATAVVDAATVLPRMLEPQTASAFAVSTIDTEAYAALLRREQQADAIQRSLGWRLLGYYGPYKRRFVLPAWRRAQRAVQRLLRTSPDQPINSYERWARFSDRFRGTISADAHDGGRDQLTPVSVSVIVTVDEASLRELDAAISSVLAQDHVEWDLCLAFVANTDTETVHSFSLLLASKDPRVRLDPHPYPTHSAATNAAIAMARGALVAIMPPTVVLACDALGSAVRAFTDTAGDVLYSDEDLRDDAGRRYSPQLKPGWSPDLLLSWMYWSRLVFYRRTFLERLIPLRPELEGAHYYDLALRAAEQRARIVHLPRILSHVHSPPTPTAGASTTSGCDAGRRALEAALTRRGITGSVRWHPEGDVYRVQRTVTGTAKVSIIIPTRDGLGMLQRCLRAVETTDYPSYEVVIVDNGSVQEATLAFLAETRHKVLRAPGPFNFSRLNNLAVAHTEGQHLLFLNNDTEPCHPDWLRALEEHTQRPEVGAVGAKLLYPNGRIQHAGIAVGINGLAGHPYRFQRSAPEGIRNVSAVTAACLMMRRETFDAVGGFDERLPVNSNDVDLCLRVRDRGYLVVYTPHAILYHYESRTRGVWATPDDAWLMTRRWRGRLLADPYYSPNGDLAEETGEMDLSKPDGMICLYGGSGRDDRSLQLGLGMNAGQRFFATGGDLTAIMVRSAIEGEHPNTVLRLMIRESPTSSVNVRIVERAIVGRSDNELWFCFEPIADSADRYWYFFLEVVERHAVTLCRSAVISDVMGPCFENHEPTHGTLLFQLYARAPYRCATSPP